MQVTIELPDELAHRVEPEKEHLAELIARGLSQRWAESSGGRRELIEFLGRGPRPDEIVAFRPSPAQIERARDLLHRGSAGVLTANEQAELDEMAHLDTLVTLLKAAARQHLG
ncbi:hypothetical protein LBMAG56_18910 [Verrucomicrobiota bacterium]|nr:hypothetical protein LBMAG56_18910 [Verrucomicrobiota bacterium]